MMTTQPVFADDAGFSVPRPVSAPEFSSPIPGSPGQYMVTQDWMCWNGSFVPTPIGTVHPDSAAWVAKNFISLPIYLTAESNRVDMGGGMVKWKRTYCSIPPMRFDYSTISYQFPGLVVLTGTGVLVATLRSPITKPAPCQIQYNYYQVGTLNASYANAGLIPVIAATRFAIPQLNGVSLIGLTDVSYLSPIGGAGVLTLPAADEYLASPPQPIGLNPGYNPTWLGNNSTLYPIVVQASEISRWQGNIYQRVTKYTQAL